MKKIISLFASISMLVASMAFAPVASAADAPTLEIEATRITDFTDYAKYDFGEGYAAYLVTFNLTGLELETVMGTGMAKNKANGTSLSSYTVQYTAEVNGDKDDAWVFDTLSALGDKTLDTWNGKVHTFSYGNGSSMIYPAKGTAATIAKTDKITVYTAILVMAEGETFKMTVNKTGCKINVSEFEKDSFKAGTRVESVLAVSDVTIPMAEGGEGDDTAEKMNDGVLVEGGLHDGKTSATTSVYAGASVTSIKVKDSDGKEQTASLPELLGNGYTKIMTVILYNANEMAGKTFNVEYFAGEEVVKTYTYKVPSSN